MSFFPDDKEVPKELVFDDIRIRKLRATDNELDYQAAVESGFRAEDFPKDTNLEQIAKHESDHNDKKQFTFTIVNSDETYCYGCIFVKPITPFLKFAFFNDRMLEHLKMEEEAAALSFWITPKGHEINLYDKLLENLPKWFTEEWPYEHLFLFAMRPSEDEIVKIEKLNLTEKFLFRVTGEKYILWSIF